MYFRYFFIISPLKRVGPFIWTNLNPHHTRMLCAKFGWNWPSGSWEEDENVKSLQTEGQTDRRTMTDNRRSEKLSWAFSSGELINNCYQHLSTDCLYQIYYMFSSLIILQRKIEDYTQMNIFSLTPIHTFTSPCTMVFIIYHKSI